VSDNLDIIIRGSVMQRGISILVHPMDINSTV
jgi:hypothetical protein